MRCRWPLVAVLVLVPAGTWASGPCEDGSVRNVDLAADHWACRSVLRVEGEGIIEPCWRASSGPEALFCTGDLVRRRDMAVWIERALHVGDRGWAPPAAVGVFEDVPRQLPDAAWIEQFRADGITGGCSAAPLLYCPDDAVTRAQMAVFLLVARHLEEAGWTVPPCTGIFADVPCPGHWAADWIEELYREGITSGCGTDPPRYCPDDAVTREQMAVFVLAALVPSSVPASGGGR